MGTTAGTQFRARMVISEGSRRSSGRSGAEGAAKAAAVRPEVSAGYVGALADPEALGEMADSLAGSRAMDRMHSWQGKGASAGVVAGGIVGVALAGPLGLGVLGVLAVTGFAAAAGWNVGALLASDNREAAAEDRTIALGEVSDRLDRTRSAVCASAAPPDPGRIDLASWSKAREAACPSAASAARPTAPSA